MRELRIAANVAVSGDSALKAYVLLARFAGVGIQELASRHLLDPMPHLAEVLTSGDL